MDEAAKAMIGRLGRMARVFGLSGDTEGAAVLMEAVMMLRDKQGALHWAVWHLRHAPGVFDEDHPDLLKALERAGMTPETLTPPPEGWQS